MDTIIDKIENSEALIKIKLKEDDYQPRVNQKIKDYSKKATIKGFRPGKVPPGLIKQMYGNSFLIDEINSILSEELNKVLRENDIQFLGEPLPSDDQQSIDWENQKDFEFLYTIGYAEDFDIKIDKKIKVDYNAITIDKKVMDETINNLRKQFGEPLTPEEVGEEDTVYGSLSSTDDSINQEISIDVAELDKGSKKKIIGKKTDESMDIDVNKAFTDKTYFERISRLTKEDLKSSKGKLSFKLKGINRTAPAEINQELFDKTFGKDSVKSEEEFMKKVEETISVNYQKETDQYFDFKVREALVGKLKIKLPEEFLKKWLQKTNENITQESIDNEFGQYADELKWSLIRNHISKSAELKVENPEVVAQAKELILQQFGGAAVADQLGDQLDTFANNYLQGENGNNYMKTFNMVMDNKVFAYLKENITVKEKSVTLDEFRKMI